MTSLIGDAYLMNGVLKNKEFIIVSSCSFYILHIPHQTRGQHHYYLILTHIYMLLHTWIIRSSRRNRYCNTADFSLSKSMECCTKTRNSHKQNYSELLAKQSALPGEDRDLLPWPYSKQFFGVLLDTHSCKNAGQSRSILSG